MTPENPCPDLNPARWPGIWKVLYTLVYLMSLVGLASAGVIIAVKMGHAPASLLSYYRGDPDAFRYPKSLLNLAETAHFHAMIAPLLFAFLAFPLPWTPVPTLLRRVAVGLGTGGVVLLVINPWLLRYGPSPLVGLKYLGGVMLISGVALTGALVVRAFFHRGKPAI